MSKKWFGSGIALGSLGLGLVAAASTPLGWQEAFEAAKNRSETYGEQQELVRQAQEKYKQAIGSILPNVTANWNYTQDLGINSSLVNPIQKIGKITATQPVFAYSVFAGLSETTLQEKAQESTQKETLVQLYESVVENFYQVLAAEKSIEDVRTESKLYDKQIAQLQAWVKIGRARPADVTQVQAQLAQLNASIESYNNTLDTAREEFAFLTGLSSKTPLEDPYPYAFEPSIAEMDQYLDAVERRPEVQAAAFTRDAADQAISVAQGLNFPTVQVSGDYYYQYTGSFIAPTWDVVLGVSLPIFAGGTIESQVREAASVYHQNELLVSGAQRAADQEIRTYFAKVRDDNNEVKAFQSAKDISWVNYQQEVHDYRLGLVTNLDVLQSLTTFVTNVLSLDQEKFQEKSDYLYFLAATGRAKDVAF